MTNANDPVFGEMMAVGEIKKTEGGLTKREYFASQALTGLLANITNISGEWCGQLTPDFMASQAVKAADALIAELNKENR